jgi:hypothetical protein
MRCLLVRNVAWPTQGTAKITLSVAFNAALEMNPDGKWALNTDDKITMAIDGHSLSHARTHRSRGFSPTDRPCPLQQHHLACNIQRTT